MQKKKKKNCFNYMLAIFPELMFHGNLKLKMNFKKQFKKEFYSHITLENGGINLKLTFYCKSYESLIY